MLIRKQNNYSEEEILNALLEKAFCEGYEYAQKEFGEGWDKAKNIAKTTAKLLLPGAAYTAAHGYYNGMKGFFKGAANSIKSDIADITDHAAPVAQAQQPAQTNTVAAQPAATTRRTVMPVRANNTAAAPQPAARPSTNIAGSVATLAKPAEVKPVVTTLASTTPKAETIVTSPAAPKPVSLQSAKVELDQAKEAAKMKNPIYAAKQDIRQAKKEAREERREQAAQKRVENLQARAEKIRSSIA